MDDKLRGQLTDAGAAPGQIVAGQFRVTSCIGVGSYGSVYRAQQLTLQREVALKILHPVSRGDEYIFGRFEREAQILSKLKHKNIVEVYSFGIDDGQRCYMSMQLLEGQTLAQLLQRESKLPWQRAVQIVIQVCEAMAAAHKHGIVHRDLTPRNIMLLQDPEPDFVKVLDFGLCGSTPENAHNMQSLTQTGALIGTVHYMSPEVCQGKKADRRSDVYSLGCVLYECLAGRPPLDADEAVSVLFMQTTATPARLKSVRVGAKMPDDLELAVFKAMQKAPEDRFQTAEDMKAVLECIMEGKEATPYLVAVPLPDPDAETAARKKRKTALLAAAGAVMGVMAILVAVQIIRWNSLQLPPSADLRTGEKLMDEGLYEESVPLFMKVVHSKLNDQDATQVVKDMTDLAEMLRDDDRRPEEVGLRGAADAAQTVIEAATDTTDNLPQSFPLAKAHVLAAQIIHNSNHLDSENLRGLTAEQNEYCQAAKFQVLGWGAAGNRDKTLALRYIDEAIARLSNLNEPAMLAKALEAKRSLLPPDSLEYKNCVEQTRKLIPLLLATRNRESTVALEKTLWQLPVDEDTVPLLREVESLDREHPISHNGRAKIYDMLGRALQSTHPAEALKWQYLASEEVEKPRAKTEFYYRELLDIANAEMKQHPEKAVELVQRVLTMSPNSETLSPLSRSHIMLMAIAKLPAIGHVEEAKTCLGDLIPKLSRQLEMHRVSLLDKVDHGRLESYCSGSRDLITCYALASDKKAAAEVLRKELQTFGSLFPDDTAWIKRAHEDYEQAMKTEPLP